MTAQRYPLHWPDGYPRTASPQRSNFGGTPDKIRKEMVSEVERLGGRNLIISTNVELRQDGYPRAGRKPLAPDEAGVAVYFDLQGTPYVFACDKWDCVAHNMRAIQKTIEALRGMERWGVSDMMARAFTGFKAIPAQSSREPWAAVLNVPKNATPDQITQAYRSRLKQVHPDHGGSAEEFQRVQDAYREATP